MTRTTDGSDDRSSTDADGGVPRSPLFGVDTDVPTRVLVLGMVRSDGVLAAADVQPVAEACGQTPEQVRSCLRRLVAEGLFSREGTGRDAVFRTTPDGVRVLSASLDRIRLAMTQDRAGKGWDRRWHLAAFAVPETKRAGRDAFRDLLLDLGGAPIHNGLYVSARDWRVPAAARAVDLGISEHVTFASSDDLTIAGTSDPRTIADRLWSIDEIGRRYQAFIDEFSHVPALLEQRRLEHHRLTEAEFLPGSIVFGTRFQECFNEDPLLPPELLPRPWPGRAARELMLTCRRLGVLLREEHDEPKLFAPWDDLLLTFRS